MPEPQGENFLRDHLFAFGIDYLVDLVYARVDKEMDPVYFHSAARLSEVQAMAAWLPQVWNAQGPPRITAADLPAIRLGALMDWVLALYKGHEPGEPPWQYVGAILRRTTPAAVMVGLEKELSSHWAPLRAGFSDAEWAAPVFAAELMAAARALHGEAQAWSPATAPAQILRDALFDYVGRDDYLASRAELYRELKAKNRPAHPESFVQESQAILESHQYFSDLQQARRADTQRRILEEFPSRRENFLHALEGSRTPREPHWKPVIRPLRRSQSG